MIKSLLLFVIAANCSFGQIENEKFVIGTLPNEGFFSSFISVVSNLMWADKNNKTPVVHWDERSLMYQRKGYNGSKNPWEYYFEPVSELATSSGDVVWNMGHAPDDSHLFLSFLHEREVFHSEVKFQAKEAIDKYIKIKPSIQMEIDAFYNANMAGRTNIGIHLRGTDSSTHPKVKEAIAAASLKAAEEAANAFNGDVQFFVATDDESLLTYVLDHVTRKVIYCDSHRRSKNGKALHTRNSGSERAILGEDLLIEGILLSRCDHFVHSHSSVPIAVMSLNPELPTDFIEPMQFIYKYIYNVEK